MLELLGLEPDLLLANLLHQVIGGSRAILWPNSWSVFNLDRLGVFILVFFSVDNILVEFGPGRVGRLLCLILRRIHDILIASVQSGSLVFPLASCAVTRFLCRCRGQLLVGFKPLQA